MSDIVQLQDAEATFAEERANADMVPPEEEFEAGSAEKQPREKIAAGWRVLAVFGALVGVLGLVLGYLGRLIPSIAFVPDLETGKWHGSYLGNYVFILTDLFKGGAQTFKDCLNVKNIIDSFKVLGLGGVYSASLYWLHYVLLLAIAASFATAIAALALKKAKAAKRCAYASVALPLFAYGALYLVRMACPIYSTDLAAKQILSFFDITSLLTLVMLAGLLILAGLASKKWYGFLNAALLFFFALAAVGFFFPATTNGYGNIRLIHIIAYSSQVSKAEDVGFLLRLAVILTGLLTLANLAVSAVRLCSDRFYLLDLVRAALQVLLSVALALVLVFFPAGGVKAPAWDAVLTLPALLLIAAGIAACFVALVAVIAAAVRKKKTARAEKTSGSWLGEEQVREEPEEEPEEEQQELPRAEEQEEPAEEQEEQAEEPAPEPAVEPQEAMSEFERSMEALAHGVPPTPAPPASSYEAAQPPFEPYGAQPYRQQPYVPVPAGYQSSAAYGLDAQYTYDPFISGLTPQEKNEFGDLFIAGKYGQIGLPHYVIGGNNKEFFTKVFIYLGRYRNNISAGLLNKLYDFVSKNS